MSIPDFLTFPTAAYLSLSMARACSGDMASTFSLKIFPVLFLTLATNVGIVLSTLKKFGQLNSGFRFRGDLSSRD